MPTTITGPVRMPDGTIPTHGRVIFTRLKPLAGERIVTTAPVIADISGTGTISIALDGQQLGTPYSVRVEQWSAVAGRLISEPLPDVVVTDDGTGPIGNFTALPPVRADTYFLNQGDSASLPVTLLDANRRPANVSDAFINGWLERGAEQTSVTVAKVNAAAGIVEMVITAEVSAGLTKGEYTGVIKLTVGTRVKTIRGKIKII